MAAAVVSGTGEGSSANAGIAVASTAVHASAAALRTFRRMERSLSWVRPHGHPAGWGMNRAERRGSGDPGCKEKVKP
ncbi:hypothetical protein GCM10010265_01800 [Streptomyces griseoincarnatus]|nr:hypothetical protein GCM10010265_01800 [Streptomyces griseoincarnatus]